MKKLVFTLIALTFMKLGSLNAQTFTENYLGVDFMMYKGALFKLNENAISGFSHSFYSDLKNCQRPYDRNVIYPDDQYTFNTQKDSLINRIFKVEDIIGKDGTTISVNSYLDKPIFLLRDTVTKQAIYYIYDKEYEHNFPFLTSKILLDINTICAKIEYQKDDFTNEITINNPIIESGGISSMILYKVIKSGKASYYLSLHTYSSSLKVGGTGVIILFDNGTKMNKPTAKIDVEYDESAYAYSAWIPLTEVEVKTLTTRKISKFRLYIFDEEVSASFSDKFTYYVKCVMDKK
jgi:hypothetical protein